MDSTQIVLALITAAGGIISAVSVALNLRSASRRKDTSARFKEMRALINELQQENTRRVARIDQLADLNLKNQSALVKLRDENDALRLRLQNMDQLYAELGQRLEGEMKMRSKLQSENDALKLEVEALRGEVEDLRQRLRRYEES